jgi:hypothetical protein
MLSKNKILDFVYYHKNELDEDWRPKLDRMNIWNDVGELWFGTDQYESNVIFAYMVLAYSNLSDMLDAHKNRYDNKLKILTHLVGPSCLTNERYRDMLYNQDKVLNRIIKWYIEYQKDWRWGKIASRVGVFCHDRCHCPGRLQ